MFREKKAKVVSSAHQQQTDIDFVQKNVKYQYTLRRQKRKLFNTEIHFQWFSLRQINTKTVENH